VLGFGATDWGGGGGGTLALAGVSLLWGPSGASMGGTASVGAIGVEAVVGGGAAVGGLLALSERWGVRGAGRSASQIAATRAARRKRTKNLERTWARPYSMFAPDHGRPLPRALTWSDRNIGYRRVEGSA